jgi:hypothetical protein
LENNDDGTILKNCKNTFKKFQIDFYKALESLRAQRPQLPSNGSPNERLIVIGFKIIYNTYNYYNQMLYMINFPKTHHTLSIWERNWME